MFRVRTLRPGTDTHTCMRHGHSRQTEGTQTIAAPLRRLSCVRNPTHACVRQVSVCRGCAHKVAHEGGREKHNGLTRFLSSLSKEAGCRACTFSGVKFPQPVNETTRELKQLDSQLEQLRFAARQFLRSYRVVNARTARSRVPRAPIGYNYEHVACTTRVCSV